MSSIRVSGNTSGYYDLTVPDIAGNNTLPINQIVAADSNGFVGIGTTTAYSASTDFEVKATDPKIVINNTGQRAFGLLASGTKLHIRDESDNQDLVTITEGGNVGIGTTSPDLPLDVSSSVSNSYVATFQNTANNLELKIGTVTGGYLNIQGANASNNAAYQIALNAEGGNVGIGDSEPDAKLHVAGNVKIGSASSSAWASSIHDAGGLDVIVGSGSTGLRVWDDNAQAVPRFLVQRGGNVGVNTSTPASHLDVKGNLRITRNVAAGDVSEGNWVFNISMESAAYYGSLYISPSVSTGELSIMGDKFRVTQNSGVQINSDTNNSTSTDNIAIRYNGTSGAHQSGYLFKDKRGSVNAAVKNNLQDDSPTNYGAHLELHSSQFGSLNRGITLRNSGKVEFDKMPNFATRPYYTNTELGAGAVVDFHNPHVNTGNHFDGTTNRFNAPYAGDYYFAFHSNIWKNATGIMYFNWHVNGTDISSSYAGRFYGYYAGGWENMMGFVVIPLAANDYVDLRAGGGGPKVDGNSYGQFIGYALTSP